MKKMLNKKTKTQHVWPCALLALCYALPIATEGFSSLDVVNKASIKSGGLTITSNGMTATGNSAFGLPPAGSYAWAVGFATEIGAGTNQGNVEFGNSKSNINVVSTTLNISGDTINIDSDESIKINVADGTGFVKIGNSTGGTYIKGDLTTKSIYGSQTTTSNTLDISNAKIFYKGQDITDKLKKLLNL